MVTKLKIFLTSTILITSAFANEIVLVDKGRSLGVIVIGEEATSIEKHASKELARYIYEMTRVKVEITSKETSASNLIVIGRSHTNPVISQLIQSGKIVLDSETPGNDGFIIQSVTKDKQNILVLCGSADRSSLYAVYHLLENYLGVGFFENGDQIPSATKIKIPDIHYSHKPRFRVRINQQGCIWYYTYHYWELEKFKTLIDWMVKKKYNAFWWNDPGRTGIIKRVFERNSLLSSDSSAGLESNNIAGISWQNMTPEWEKHELKLLGDVAKYAISRGMDVIGYCPVPELPESFLEKYPEEKVLEVEWNAIAGSKRYYLNPQSRMFSRIMRDGAEEFENVIGSPVHWWSQAPYGEMLFTNVTEEEIKDIYLDYADGTYRALASLHPDFGWLMSGWGYLVDPYWNQERSSRFFNRTSELFGVNRYCVSDPEAYHQPIFEKFNGFENNGWCFGVIHSYAGTTQLFGNLVDTKDQVINALNSKWGDNLYAYWVQPEVIEHNYFFYEAVSQIGWDPQGFSLEKFTRQFVKNRYSGVAVDDLVKAWSLLIKAYYSETTYHDQAVYLSPPALRDHSIYPAFFDRIPLVQKALKLFFANSDLLNTNKFFQTDLIDVLVQYNSGLYNFHYYHLMEAFKERNVSLFELNAKKLQEILDAQIKILSTHPDKYLAREIEDAARLPQENPNYSNDIAIRTRFTSLVPINITAGKVNNTDDYARKDMFELVKDYYAPRARLHIEALRKALALNEPAPTRSDLSNQCYTLIKNFIENSQRTPSLSQPAADLVKITYEVFQSLRLMELKKQSDVDAY